MTDQTIGLQEYSTLTVMRVAVKMLTRVNVRPDSFRNPLLRRLSVSACDVLREIVNEIESYDPAMIERERSADEQKAVDGSQAPNTLPDVARVAESDSRRALQFMKPTEPTPSPLSAPVETLLKTLFPGKTEPRPYKKRNLSPEARARISARASEEHTCPHCGRVGRGPVMFRLHFDRCAKRTTSSEVLADVSP